MPLSHHPRRTRVRTILLLLAGVMLLLIGYPLVFTTPLLPGAPDIAKTETPGTQPAPVEVGSYDVLGQSIARQEAATLAQTAEGRAALSPEQGAVAITDDLLQLGRQAFYEETFGNEVFFTDVLGVLDGPINLRSITRAILALRGRHTTNLQIPLEQDVTVGGRTFRAGTTLDTGLDVAPGALVPLGMRARVSQGRVQVGITCAACHAAVDGATGRIREGAPNADADTGLLLAFATNSAGFFRQTGVNPTTLVHGAGSYTTSAGARAPLPDPQALEDAVDADLLAWPAGSFDSTGDLKNNPSQTPTSYTFGAWPYGWSGFASVGWFHGLTTLNNNVHATNSDMTTGADSAEPLLGISKELYLGAIFQRAASGRYRLPDGANPSAFFEQVDPTPGAPGMNRTIPMPGYPRGSIFMLDGLMANTPGLPVASQLNGMSAWQNTLAPPPAPPADQATLQRGAEVFRRAGCISCHAGRYLTNNQVLAQPALGTQPARAQALAAFPRIFGSPLTYLPNTDVPLPPNPPTIAVPLEITPEQSRQLAYAQGDPAGGYKVPSLIGLYVSAPYLHDGGVAAGAGAASRRSAGSMG